jgi:hypothetical protein
MLLEAEERIGHKNALSTLADGTLGTPQLIWDWMTGVGKDEALRRALLDWLEKDKSFVVDDKDDTFRQVAAAVGPAIDFIVTGHTHLERAIEIADGRYYFNSGTWIRLMRFTPDMLKDTKSFKEVYEVLVNGRMERLDEARFKGEPFVMDQTSAVSIIEEGGKAVGRLTHVIGDGSGNPLEIKKFPEK